MAKNGNLHSAKSAKNDEFYTRYEDIEKEVYNYRDFFEGKTVLCNCDDPLESNFTKYFILNFRFLKLKKLICTFYDINGKAAYVFVYEGQDINGDGVINGQDIDEMVKMQAFRHALVDDYGFDFENKEESWKKGLYGSGDFRSQHCIEYLKMADVVVTNPPFSLFRQYVAQLMKYGKRFLIVGCENSVIDKEIFQYIKENNLWLGINHIHTFNKPNGETQTFGNICWYTNIENKNRNTQIVLYKEYSAEKYPKYDNFNAIKVSTINEIPCDYNGFMGVPITFLHKYCPKQFEIVDLINRYMIYDTFGVNENVRKNHSHCSNINGKAVYTRVLIRKRNA